MDPAFVVSLHVIHTGMPAAILNTQWHTLEDLRNRAPTLRRRQQDNLPFAMMVDDMP
jgi:hypothetical protein